MIARDGLRLPLPTDPSAWSYKDWLHLNVFEPELGLSGLVNVSLHGPPDYAQARVVSTALFHQDDLGWLGDTVVGSYADAHLGMASITTESVAVAIDHSRGVAAASVRLPAAELTLDLTAHHRTRALDFESRMPLGNGWISWYVVPRMIGEGRLSLRGHNSRLSGVPVYHDHNWGRWRWGDDFGWEWGCFMATSDAPTVVFSRTTDRTHRRLDTPSLHVTGFGAVRRFHRVAVEHLGSFLGHVRRVPGALAALHQDRRRPRLPSSIEIEAALGKDRITVSFTVRGAAQVIAADPITAGYSFINELAGGGRIEGNIGGRPFQADICGVVEYVN